MSTLMDLLLAVINVAFGVYFGALWHRYRQRRITTFEDIVMEATAAINERLDRLSAAVEQERAEVVAEIDALKATVASLREQIGSGVLPEAARDITDRIDEITQRLTTIVTPEIGHEPAPDPEGNPPTEEPPAPVEGGESEPEPDQP